MQTFFLDKYKRLEQIILHSQTQKTTHTLTYAYRLMKVSARIFCRQTGFCHPLELLKLLVINAF